MTTEQIAARMKELNEQLDHRTIFNELYDPQARSIEMKGNGGNPEFQDITGVDKIIAKAEWWENNFTVHSVEVSEPVIADNWFAVRYVMDAEHKESGQRHSMSELGVYQVKDGKVVREQFFYDAE